jgi:hypothetical protein
MQVPVGLFELGLWAAVVGVGLGAAYLLVVLVVEWRRRELW